VAPAVESRRTYIYSPLFEDDPKTIPLLEPDVDWTEHQVIMNSRTLEALRATARLAAELMDKARRGGLVEGKWSADVQKRVAFVGNLTIRHHRIGPSHFQKTARAAVFLVAATLR
jgi:hypothetical protein